MPGPKNQGTGLFSDVQWLKEKVADHDVRLDEHDKELAEIDADVLALTEICARSHQRAAARLRLARIRAKRSK
jgi:hypothetical protein